MKGKRKREPEVLQKGHVVVVSSFWEAAQCSSRSISHSNVFYLNAEILFVFDFG